MSGIDGLGVLNVMNKEHLIEDIPVIMISSEDSALHIRQAYEMGVSDYISRPFDTNVVRQRVYNTIKLYAKQRKLIDLVAGQMQEKEKNNQIMVNILSHIVEVVHIVILDVHVLHGTLHTIIVVPVRLAPDS